jgi:N-ethylmaleimide reductase
MQISEQGIGYLGTPGIHTDEQVAGWAKVTAAVHAAGGKIMAQLWHVGRASHPELLGGRLPVAPSAVAAEGRVHTAEGAHVMPVPRALEQAEIAELVETFRRAAERAQAAGFDGVVLHGANGYLLEQFLRDGSNRREDLYGGSIENRLRFPVQVAQAAVDVWGRGKVGYKISPWLTALAGPDSDPASTFVRLAKALNDAGIAFIDVIEEAGSWPEDTGPLMPRLRDVFGGAIIVGGGYDARSGEWALVQGTADLVSYGRLFLGNPDLPARFRLGAPLVEAAQAYYYQGGSRGYTDYPPFETK